jgi:hypothetical protein
MNSMGVLLHEARMESQARPEGHHAVAQKAPQLTLCDGVPALAGIVAGIVTGSS